MANRLFNQFWLGLEKQRVTLFGKVAIGSTGACTISAVNSKGISTVTRNAAGKYTFVMQDTYVKFMGMKVTFIKPSDGLTTVSQVSVISETVATAATKNIVVQCLDFAGAAVDPDSGSTMYVEFQFSNTNVA